MGRLVPIVVVVACVSSCGTVARDCRADPPRSAGEYLCQSPPGWDDRDFILRLPPNYDATRPVPVVLGLHGGGGKAAGFNKTTCKNGNEDDPSCLSRTADRHGYAVVFPDGTAAPLVRNQRTWNAGGGKDGLNCASGRACKDGVDDVRYFRDLLDHLQAILFVDTRRVHATGFSNGGAMAHRLGCELAGRIASIAPAGGANQFMAAEGCSPSRPVPVLHIHGVDDPCWEYGGGSRSCLPGDGGRKTGVEDSLAPHDDRHGWASINGCTAPPVDEELEDRDPDDHTRITRRSWTGCREGADVVLLRVDGAGHTWPGGEPYFPRFMIGRVSYDLSASEEVLEFFLAHPMP
ncbi:MAG: hypothetical protein HY904_08265 [Deltaproteobacteria bacterium]|nr:hypothetical protein [Deltaproteobacteria bacterium]